MSSLRTLRRTSLRVVPVALALGATGLGAAASPAAAADLTATRSIDCSALTTDGATVWLAPTGTLTVDFTNCDYWALFDADGAFVGSEDPITDAGTVEVAAGESLDFEDELFVVDAKPLYPETVPSGTRLLVAEAELGASAAVMDLGEDNSGGDGERWLNGDPTCDLSVSRYSEHVYTTIEISVSIAGEFTFRGVATDPRSRYLDRSLPRNPIRDPFLALYSDFDPAMPDSGVVGCSDDLNDLFDYDGYEMGEELSDGTIMEGHQPYFVTNLEPGDYVLVVTLYGAYNTADWAEYAPASVTFEMWGPEDSLCLSDDVACIEASGGGTLPVTGAGTAHVMWWTLALAALGSLGVFAGRRRLS